MALARVEQLNLGLSAGAVAASYVLSTPHFAASVAAGAFLEAVNLGAIYRGAKRLFAGRLMANGWIGILSMRLILLSLAIYLAMRMGAHPIALLIGLSMTMPATLIDAWLNRPPVIDPAELPTFLEEFEEDDADFYDDDDQPGERLWSTGHLLTSRSPDLEPPSINSPSRGVGESEENGDPSRPPGDETARERE